MTLCVCLLLSLGIDLVSVYAFPTGPGCSGWKLHQGIHPTLHMTTTFGARHSSALAETGGQDLMILAGPRAIFGAQGWALRSLIPRFDPIIGIAMRQGVRPVVTGLLGAKIWNYSRAASVPATQSCSPKIALLMLVMSAVGLIVGSEVSERHQLALDP